MTRLALLLASALVYPSKAACGPSPSAPSAPGGAAAPTPVDNREHGDAPHGGTLTDWGGSAYHVDFTVDHDQKEATVYIRGSDARSPAPLHAEKVHLTILDPATKLDRVAAPLAGEPDGTSSRFVGTHDTLFIVREFTAPSSGEVDGAPCTGDFAELPHGADHQH